jgi:UDP-N-acetylmuramate dehydrogenase
VKLDDIHDLLVSSARGRVARDVQLAPMTTYKLGGPASVLFEPHDVDDVALLAEVLAKIDAAGDVPVFALGRGSNVVISDHGWKGVVVRMSDAWNRIDEKGGRSCVAGAAISLPVMANWAARRGLSGIEFGVAIPGSVGGAVRMNAGAHGGQMSDHLESVRLFDLRASDVVEVAAAGLGLSYRHSDLTDNQIVLEAELLLRLDDPDAVKARMDDYRRHRAATQPGAHQNAGSTFKNPPGDSAGRLVEAAGLKGFRVGAAHVSELHANFFIAPEGASAQDVFDLVEEVGARVAEISGVELEPEVRFLGEFATRAVGGPA